jgi:hypothetical protein
MAGQGIAQGLQQRWARKAEKAEYEKAAELMFPGMNLTKPGGIDEFYQAMGGMPAMGATPAGLAPGGAEVAGAQAAAGQGLLADNAKWRGLLTQGGQFGQAAALQEYQRRTAPQPQNWQKGDNYLYETKTGQVQPLPEWASESELVTLKPGEVLYDPITEKPLFTAPKDTTLLKTKRTVQGADGNYYEEDVWNIYDEAQKAIVGEVTGGQRSLQGASQQGTLTHAQKGKYQGLRDTARQTRMIAQEVFSDWKPAYNHIEFQGGMWLLGKADRSAVATALGKAVLPDSVWNEFQDYVDWQRGMQGQLNAHIKMMTGAQMSHYEIPRLLKEMATQSDGAASYRAKMEGLIEHLARVEVYWDNALASGKMTLDEVQNEAAAMIASYLEGVTGAYGGGGGGDGGGGGGGPLDGFKRVE